MRGIILAALLTQAGSASAQTALVVGIGHTPIVVADLDRASEDYRKLGFAIKPGRPHADGIRNRHVKFPDGSEIELITAPVGVDALTSEYRAKLRTGDGPVYFGLYTPDPMALAARLRALDVPMQQKDGLLTFPAGHPLHPLFFSGREKAPTDRPEHFAHANTALRLSGFWIRANRQEKRLLTGLGVPLQRMGACGPMGGDAEVAHLREGDLVLVRTPSPDGGVAAARVEVKSLETLSALFKKEGLDGRLYTGCGQASLWLPPSQAHGIWLQFIQAP